MAILDDLKASVETIVAENWTHTDGRVVPGEDSVGLGNDRVELDAVILYADLADSTELAISSQVKAAEIFKAYLQGATRLIRASNGEVRSFDGDRVMGVFIGENRNTRAAKCGLQINWFFKNLLVKRFHEFYGDAVGSFNQTVGIDASRVHIIRGGIRAHNDLVWVGRAPNVAAKLSSIHNGKHSTFITEKVYSTILDSSKLSEGKEMWTRLSWKAGEKYGVPIIFGSTYWWKP